MFSRYCSAGSLHATDLYAEYAILISGALFSCGRVSFELCHGLFFWMSLRVSCELASWSEHSESKCLISLTGYGILIDSRSMRKSRRWSLHRGISIPSGRFLHRPPSMHVVYIFFRWALSNVGAGRPCILRAMGPWRKYKNRLHQMRT
jgi:hypothetical protein